MLAGAIASAQQQVTVGTPYHALSDSFFENMGTSWGLRGPNWNLSVFGSPFQAAPQFGGFDPSAGANFGAGFQNNGMSGAFSANWSQGYRQSYVSQTPVLTLQNGYPGAFYDTSTSPFVISNIPVVGGYPRMGFTPYNPYMGQQANPYGNPAVRQALQRARYERELAKQNEGLDVVQPDADETAMRLRRHAAEQSGDLTLLEEPSAPNTATDLAADSVGAAGSSSAGASSAARPAPSVAEARRMREAEEKGQTEKALAFVERARNAEATGKSNVAKIYYQMAYRRASGQLKQEISERLRSLESDQ
jgi:hypothetical protein